MREALRQDAHAIEVDLRRTRDGVVVAMHDADVRRTTDGRGKLGELTLAELWRLDAGSWFDASFAGERVPTLTELVAAVPHDALLVLEVKDGPRDAPGIEADVVAALRDAHRPAASSMLKSFDPDALAAFAALAPEIPRLYVFVGHLPWLGLLVDRRPRFASALDADAAWIQKHGALLTQCFVRRAQAQGYRVVAWDVQCPRRMRRMIRFGVDAIETDHPATLRALLAEAATEPR